MDYVYKNLPLYAVVAPGQDGICHIGNPTYGSSLCGLRKIQYAAAHTKRECYDNHQLCIVCADGFERLRGESYFPEEWSAQNA